MTVKLTDKQYQIIETIRREGVWLTPNCQNKTVKKLIKMGYCDFNSSYTGIILTELGKKIDL